MKSTALPLAALLLAPLLLAPFASAQLPGVPPEFSALVDRIEDETGLQRYGAPKVSDVGDAESVTFKVQVDNTQVTFLQLACDGYCLEMKPQVSTRSGVIGPELPDATMPVIQVPAGNGGEVELTVAMSCDYAYCAFGVQAFTR